MTIKAFIVLQMIELTVQERQSRRLFITKRSQLRVQLGWSSQICCRSADCIYLETGLHISKNALKYCRDWKTLKHFQCKLQVFWTILYKLYWSNDYIAKLNVSYFLDFIYMIYIKSRQYETFSFAKPHLTIKQRYISMLYIWSVFNS